MPDRDYYLNQDPKSTEIRAEYAKYVRKLFELAGDTPEAAADEANRVIALETKLAGASLTRVQRRDPELTYHRMTLKDAAVMTPAFAWSQYSAALGVPANAPLNISSIDFFKEVDKDLTAVAIADWQSYLRFSTINSVTAALSKNFV